LPASGFFSSTVENAPMPLTSTSTGSARFVPVRVSSAAAPGWAPPTMCVRSRSVPL
jgi:hypothetical protein